MSETKAFRWRDHFEVASVPTEELVSGSSLVDEAQDVFILRSKQVDGSKEPTTKNQMLRAQPTVWTPEMDDTLIEMYNEGASIVQIQEALNVPYGTIGRRISTLKNFGEIVARENHSLRERRIMEAIPNIPKLYREGVRIGEIAAMCKLTEWQTSCIVSAFCKAGVLELRSTNRPKNNTIDSVMSDVVRAELAKANA